jgi:hypothetical protein
MPSGGRRSTSWRPGTCPNPGGRPKRPETIEARKVIVDVKTAAQRLTEEAVNTLEAAMTSSAAPWAARVAAATAVLDRGWGKPGQHVGISAALDLTRFMDLSNLSEGELGELERLLHKTGSDGGPASAH